jgi:hypothetical protein
MKKNTFLHKKSIGMKVGNCELTDTEIHSILHDLFLHLEKPHGTLENYPKRYIIEMLRESYPNAINMDEIQEYTQMKINHLMEKIWSLAANNQKIYTSPAILQILVNYVSGKDSSSVQLGNQIIVENNFIVGNEGSAVAPEPKETT